MLTEVGRRMDEHTEHFNRGIENKNKVPNNSKCWRITELKNTLESFNSRLDDVEQQTSDLEERTVEVTQIEKKKKELKKNEDSLEICGTNVSVLIFAL